MRQKRFRKGRSERAQSVTCFMVTSPDSLPPDSENQWYHFITALNSQATSSPGSNQATTQASNPVTPQASNPAHTQGSNPAHTQGNPISHLELFQQEAATPPATSSPVSASSPVSSSTLASASTIPFINQTYFQSSEPRILFGYAKPKNDEERKKDVRDIIYERIIKFQNAAFTFSR